MSAPPRHPYLSTLMEYHKVRQCEFYGRTVLTTQSLPDPSEGLEPYSVLQQPASAYVAFAALEAKMDHRAHIKTICHCPPQGPTPLSPRSRSVRG